MSRPRDGKRLLATTAFGHVRQDQPLLPFMWPMRASFFFFLSLDGSDKNSVETDRFPAQIAAGDDEKRAKHARALGFARSAYRSVPGLVSCFPASFRFEGWENVLCASDQARGKTLRLESTFLGTAGWRKVWHQKVILAPRSLSFFVAR